ncbi:hypothetical protein JTB14_030746 [Gonioctena quinquepunctata]|nr:hypothetical protein JTB14_030746 [Gonioctena quinquepunctata]
MLDIDIINATSVRFHLDTNLNTQLIVVTLRRSRTATAHQKSEPAPKSEAPPKRRVPLTKTVSKAPDTETKNKQSANKLPAPRRDNKYY